MSTAATERPPPPLPERPTPRALVELVSITTHPSAILRAGEESKREAAFSEFVDDLKRVGGWMEGHA